jgi:hypothetical protein
MTLRKVEVFRTISATCIKFDLAQDLKCIGKFQFHDGQNETKT